MNPLRVLRLFEHMTDEDCELLDLHPGKDVRLSLSLTPIYTHTHTLLSFCLLFLALAYCFCASFSLSLTHCFSRTSLSFNQKMLTVFRRLAVAPRISF